VLAGVLVLWDVDHTLVDAAGVGVRAFELGFQRVHGRPMAGAPAMAGRTDRAIARDVLRMHGLGGTDADLEALRVAAEAALAELDGELRARGRALPGAVEALAEVRRCAAAQTLLTGNIRAFAEAKVRAFGLDGYLDLDIGGDGRGHPGGARPGEPAPPAAPGRDGQSRTTWPFTTLTCRAGSGLGGGPATTAPLVILNWPPWQGQSMVPSATSLMMQPTCVQTALNALYWPRAGWVTTTLAAL